MSETLADLLADDARGAVFGDDGEYRYCLWRTWDASKPTLAFVMLNPSTADATELDPTCRRCKDFAEQWDYGTLLVGNLLFWCPTRTTVTPTRSTSTVSAWSTSARRTWCGPTSRPAASTWP